MGAWRRGGVRLATPAPGADWAQYDGSLAADGHLASRVLEHQYKAGAVGTSAADCFDDC